ncbi:MAG: M56 family metallopeptidase [Chryseolinea sp.]
METFVIYWLKVNVVISILFLTYYLLLKKEKFFKLNRLFLMGSLVLALILPITPVINTPGLNQLQHEVTGLNSLYDLYNNFSIASSIEGNNTIATNSFELAEQSPANFISTLSVKEIVFGLYLLVTLTLLIRFVLQVVNLLLLIRKTKKGRQDGISYCEHTEELSPFSFFHHLVINKSQYNAEQLNQVITHEKVHIRQYHTLDILITEIAHIFLWINPIMIFLKQYVKLNLEYLADEQVLHTGVDRKSYQFSILQTCLQTETYPLTNLFNSSKLKLRIKMMNSKRTSLAHLYKYAFVLPLIIATYFAIHPAYAQGLTLTKEQQQQLKSFEGKYKMNLKGTDFFLLISVNGNDLLLKQLWDNQEITFVPTAELEFYARKQNFPLKFIKGPDGSIVQVLAFNRDVWDKVNAEPAQKEMVLSQQQLEAMTGYYQYQDATRKDAFVQCVVRGNNLIGIQLWDGKEFVFTAQSDLEFISKEGITVKFIKNNDGIINQAFVSNRDLLDKVKEYKPIVKKEVQLTTRQLEIIEGYYLLQENKESCMQITRKGNEIVVKQLWDNAEQNFMPVSELEFFSKGNMLTFKFTKGKDGQITHLSARNGSLWEKGPKPEEKKMISLSSENLKAFEGKYSLQYEGKEVYIEITSTENGLLLKQLWNNKEISFLPTSDLEFFNKKEAFPLKFIKSTNGSIAQVEAYHKDLWSRVN